MLLGRFSVCFLVFVLNLATLVSYSHATTLRKLTLDELVARADTIVVRTCEKTEAIWLARRIYTVATVRLAHSVKGNAAVGGTIEVYVLGGRVRAPVPVKLHVPGAARVSPGEEMVLFLQSRDPKNRIHHFVGMAQGRIPVVTDPTTGAKSVRYGLPIKGVTMVDSKGQVLGARAVPRPASPDNLEGFLGRVRAIADEQAAVRTPFHRRLPQPNSLKGRRGNTR